MRISRRIYVCLIIILNFMTGCCCYDIYKSVKYPEWKTILERDDIFSGISFSDHRNGWAVGSDGFIVHTSDGGLTWEKQKSPSKESLLKVDFPDKLNGWIVGEGGTVLHTSDGGKNWEIQQSGEKNKLLRVQFTDIKNGWICGAFGSVLHTSDGGKN